MHNTTNERIRLGHFTLNKPIGHGATAVVWHGVHAQNGVAVAVKVMTGERAAEPAIRSAFFNEARACARLHHAHIIHVFDLGYIDAAAAVASDGELAEGSPYLVMELLTGGRLRLPRTGQPWKSVRLIVLDLLHALEHAHARDVIHRDIKPSNILLGTGLDQRQGLKLTDFGIARALDSADETARFAGTPRFMAPEQILAEEHRQGPWTDLYALGCVAWRAFTGRHVFPGLDTPGLLRAHVAIQPPNLPDDVPEALREWFARMLAKDPGDRYQSAADAAWALQAMESGAEVPSVESAALGVSQPWADEDEEPWTPVSGLMAPDASPTVSTDAMPTMVSSVETLREGFGSTPSGRGPALSSEDLPTIATVEGAPVAAPLARPLASLLPAPSAPIALPTCPESWRWSRDDDTPHLLRAGLGLFAVRTPSFVGRDQERDHLWDALRAVRARGQAQVVLLKGQAGCGKTRLMQWLAWRALEVGASSVFWATPEGSGGEGLGAMLARFLGLRPGDAEDVVRAVVSDFVGGEEGGEAEAGLEVEALMALCAPWVASTEEGGALRFATERERLHTLSRFLSRVATERGCAIVCMDDVHAAPDAVAFVRHHLEFQRRHPTPVLIVATALTQDTLETDSASVSSLSELDGVEQIDVELFPMRAHRELVHALLDLSPVLVVQVARHTAGNPLFAHQIIDDWIDRDVLVDGDGGLVRSEASQSDAGAALPTSLDVLWSQRLGRVSEQHGADAVRWLEWAAALGEHFELEQWRLVCEQEGLPLAADFPDDLLDRGLLRRQWNALLAFVHKALRSSVRHTAQAAGRWCDAHAACARMVRAQVGHRLFIAERMAGHLEAARLYEEALDELLRASRYRALRSEYAFAEQLLRRYEELLRGLDALEADPRWGAGWIAHARLMRRQRAKGTSELLRRTLEAAERHGWSRVAAMATSEKGFVLRDEGAFAQSREVFLDAIARLREVDEEGDELSRAMLGQVDSLVRLYALDEADAVLDEAWPVVERTGRQDLIGLYYEKRANLAVERRDSSATIAFIEKAVPYFERAGGRDLLIAPLIALGESHRHQGEDVEAEHSYRRAEALAESLGSDPLIPRFNLGLVMLHGERFDEAWEFMRKALKDAADGPVQGRFFLSVIAVAAAAGRRDWIVFDALLNDLLRFETATTVSDMDTPWCCEVAGRSALDAGEMGRAGRVLEVARRRWDAVSDADGVARVDEMLRR